MTYGIISLIDLIKIKLFINQTMDWLVYSEDFALRLTASIAASRQSDTKSAATYPFVREANKSF